MAADDSGLDPERRRSLKEPRAASWRMLDRGITRGTCLEHVTGAWCLVLDITDEDEVRVLNLEEVPDGSLWRVEQAAGCVEHLEAGRDLAVTTAAGIYRGPPDSFDRVLGPTHPDYDGGAADDDDGDGTSVEGD